MTDCGRGFYGILFFGRGKIGKGVKSSVFNPFFRILMYYPD